MNTPLDVEEQLKNIKLKALTKEESNLLWSKIEQKIILERPAAHAHVFPIMNMLKLKFAVPAFLALVLIVSSFSTVALANNAKPGDLLFPVDLALEKFQIVFASNAKKSELKVKFSEERVVEAESVLNKVSTASLADVSASGNASVSASASAQGDIKGIERAEHALNTAIEHLQKTRDELAESGNQIAVGALDMAINRLTGLAQGHISDLEKVEAKIKDNGENIKVEIRNSSDELKTKFKLNSNKGKTEFGGNAGVNIKLGIASKSDDDDDDKDDDRGGIKVVLRHIPRGNFKARQTIEVGLLAQKAHLAHGDKLGPCLSPSPTPTPSPTPDITAPVISNVTVSNITSGSASVNWNTNESATSKIWFGLSPLVINASTSFVANAQLVTSHMLNLSGLLASKTYQFMVSSADESGNTSSSSLFMFITLQ